MLRAISSNWRGRDMSQCLTFPRGALSGVSKLYAVLDTAGLIVEVGAALQKLIGGRDVIGLSAFDIFELRGPMALISVDDLRDRQGRKLQCIFEKLRFRASAIALCQPEDGILLNLSLGVDIAEVVRHYKLTASDFAPTELAMELLYLVEANSAVVRELRALGARREEARRQAEEEALTDPLTGLRNRRAFDSLITRFCREGQAFALMQLDLDYFKQVNDRLGHAAGDHVLGEVASILSRSLSARDFIARLGGDEFVILLPGHAGRERLTHIAERLIAEISRPMPFEGALCRIGASIGVASTVGRSDIAPAQIMAEADEALYAAKEAGRGKVLMV